MAFNFTGKTSSQTLGLPGSPIQIEILSMKAGVNKDSSTAVSQPFPQPGEIRKNFVGSKSKLKDISIDLQGLRR